LPLLPVRVCGIHAICAFEKWPTEGNIAAVPVQ
jgi:hypothetical protein